MRTALALVVAGGSSAAHAQSAATKAAPTASTPTIAINNVARHGFFHHVGGKFVGELETVGLTGNSCMMMLKKNSDEAITFIVSWIPINVQRT